MRVAGQEPKAPRGGSTVSVVVGERRPQALVPGMEMGRHRVTQAPRGSSPHRPPGALTCT